ncbi:flagellar motor protein MotB [Rhodocyclus tenuis]|uniref:Flagellar motor protein MotB n=2 Tax=Rhodocyclus TaxID=1064 RepID=A0A6L5JYG7_RHOTE|nr:flagellar motor protein MotB [Rhodocyclus gracilis]MQY51630.1 flagellar motor protein MotB [Rhodocyclus gracilis]MRD73111.1 flagellar motor protein MotB [Rhodocyclus gracilis]NJA89111.1 flagellar motor protein MotB [Rhodocyclus gracilis]
MSDDVRPIVIKRVKKVVGGGHGGAWKIAYADFVTAMMAFFLLMWLLGTIATGDLKGIADYFRNPTKIALNGGSGSGNATSVLNGGGRDLTKTSGQLKQGEVERKEKADNLKDTSSEKLRREFEERERTRLEELKQKIEKMIESNPTLRQFKNQLLLDITSEGLRIQIVDEKNRPMFDSGSAELKPYTRVILREIGRALNEVPNKLSLSGHTDASQYAGGDKGFSNWELSSNRANASRRELIAGGIEDFKILRVVGLASTALFDRNDPLNAVNRRIAIVVLNKRTEDSLLQEDGPSSSVEVGTNGNGLEALSSSAPGRRN